jgi:predicted AlkP superfamily phosphohydrolase/phosphomutase
VHTAGLCALRFSHHNQATPVTGQLAPFDGLMCAQSRFSPAARSSLSPSSAGRPVRFFRSSGSSKPSRLFMLGLDGSPLPLLRRLMKSGDLPNLARAFEGGSAVEMNSSLPDVSAVAWTSINTGKNPAKHGIFGFYDRKPGSMDIDIMTSTHTRAKTIWELVSDAGRRAIAINVPLSYPPQRINGVVVSDFLAPRLDKAVYPTAVLSDLERIGYRIDTDPAIGRQSLEAFVQDFKITADKRAEAVMHLMDREVWDLFFVVFMETDRLHHFMFQYIEDGDATYGPMFVDAYRHIDALAGKILAKLNDDDQLIILSDHGFTTLKYEVYINVWLQQRGYLHFAEGAKPGPATIDPSSRAFSLDPGRIYVNLKGREAGGTIDAEDAPALLDELAAGLGDLRDPQSGQQMVKDVYRAADIYAGPLFDRAPDLLLMPHDGYDIKGTFDATTLTGRGALVGMHKYDNATLFIKGHRITVDHASVHDVLPTAGRLMKLDVPSDVDGRSVID